MGYPTWLKYFKMFGFGRKTNVDILEESSGILPDSNYYNRYLGKRKWNTGMLLSLSIGQGELAVTPIQMAQYVALIANNGKTIQPHFVKGIIDSKSNKYNELIFPEIKIDVDQQKLNVIKKGMELVVNGAGTATNIRSDLVKIAGKTGTAQNPHGKNHAIFVSFAPTENPEIVVVVLVENVGYGSTHAAPIAKKVIYTFLRLKE
jgi:penicillin-binding protein 2